MADIMYMRENMQIRYFASEIEFCIDTFGDFEESS